MLPAPPPTPAPEPPVPTAVPAPLTPAQLAALGRVLWEGHRDTRRVVDAALAPLGYEFNRGPAGAVGACPVAPGGLDVWATPGWGGSAGCCVQVTGEDGECLPGLEGADVTLPEATVEAWAALVAAQVSLVLAREG